MDRRSFLFSASYILLMGRTDLFSIHDDKIKVVVLGVAQDGGVPQLGCNCERCTAARIDPEKRRLIASLGIVTPKGYTYLVDATPDIRDQVYLLNKDVERAVKDPKIPVDGIFLTHAHMGHYTGLMHLGYESISSKNIPVYCTGKMKRFLEENAPWDQLVTKENIRLKRFEEGESIRLEDGLVVEPIKLPHRQEYTDTVGFKIKGKQRILIYIPDIDSWEKWGSNTEKFLSEADIALVDGSFYSGDELQLRDMSNVPHPPVKKSIERLSGSPDLRSTKIYFTHFNHTNPILNENNAIRKRIRESGFYIAERGMAFEL